MSDDHLYSAVSENADRQVSGPRSQGPRLQRRKGRCMCIGCIFLLLILFSAIAVLVILLLVVGNQSPVVETRCGSVEGDFDTPNNVFIFRGIPYALPPEGVRRWRPPVAMSVTNGTCWKGTYKAHYDPLQCLQIDPLEKGPRGSEDCLYLNIYTPSIDPVTPLPVMVYIHGGYLQFGNAYLPGYTPSPHISARLGVVFVSIQYRLNAFGFLVLDQLPGNGNYGYWDQIEALRWVQDNIRAFGGDPNDVTIFGQSSGGTSVQALMMTSHAKGLFHKVWSLSGSPIFNKTIEDAKKYNAFFLNKTSIRNYTHAHCQDEITEACLQGIPARDVLEGVYQEWNIFHNSMDLPTKGFWEPALPVIDGHMFTDAPSNLLKDKMADQYSDVPVIIGTTAQELDFQPAPYDDVGSEFDKWDKDELFDYVARHFDPFDKRLANETFSLYPFTNASFTFANIASDLRVTCGMEQLARLTASALTSPVYHYVITASPGYPAFPLGSPWHARYAFHAIDIFAFFDAMDALYPDGSDATRSDVAFTENLQAEVMHFVKHGRVRTGTWAPLPNSTALLSGSTTPVHRYHAEQCAFWENNGFLSYAWIN